MKVTTIVGARPQFIKAAPVSAALRAAGHREVLIHTGQHYDSGLSDVFFKEMEIPAPDVNLQVGSGPHGRQTGRMLEGIEAVLLEARPDHVLVYGDTNSTLAGAVAACKLGIPIAHVEAGLRSFNRSMPEEHNRVIADHCADLLFCPTDTAVRNLAREGITDGVHRVGDTMYDAVLRFAALARERSDVHRRLGLAPGAYLLATIHRPYNTDHPETLRGILEAMAHTGRPIVFPVHPRTRARIDALEGVAEVRAGRTCVRLVDPVGYLDMLALEQGAGMILTDSGGVQKEAYFFGVPCVTVRPETEWVETVEDGWNIVAGTDPERIVAAVARTGWPAGPPGTRFGDGKAAPRIVEIMQARGGGQ